MSADGRTIAWDALRSDWRFRVAQVLVYLKILAVVVLFDPQAFETFALVKSTASHALGYLLVAMLVWLALRHGPGIFVWSPLHLAALGVLLTFAVATPFALDPYVGLYGATARYLGLTQMLDNVVLFVAAGILFRTPADCRRVLGVALVSAAPVLAYAVIQRLGADPISYRAEHTLAIATFGHYDVSGAFFSLVAGTSFGIALLAWERSPRPARAALVALAILAVSGLSVASARNGVLGLAGAWIAIVALIAVGPRQARWKAGVAAGAALAASVGVLLSPIGPRLAQAVAGDPGTVGRIEIWRSAGKLVAARPILGVGPDNFAVGYESVHAQSPILPGWLQSSTHNWFLYAATSAGALGAFAMVLLVAFGIAAGLALAKRGDPRAMALVPLVGFLAQGLVDVNDVGIDWILWLSLGVLAGAIGRSLPLLRGRVVADPALATVLGLAALALAAVGVTGAVNRVQASEAMLASEDFTATDRADLAVPQALRAVELDPGRPDHWSSLGVALVATQQPAKAVFAFSRATELAPWHAIYWKNLGIARLQVQDENAAVAAFERAVRADPYEPQALDFLARVALARGQLERAAELGTRSVETFPSVASAYEAPVRADVRLGRVAEAERLARLAILTVPASPLPHVLLAEVYANSRRTAEAFAEIDAALALSRNYEPAKALNDQLLRSLAPPPPPAAVTPAPPPVTPPPVAPIVARYQVVSGDSLWSISEQKLGNGSRWPELYALNRAVIGPDPSVILSGVTLDLPR